MAFQKAGLTTALPFLLNPATLGIAVIGVAGWGLYNLLQDDEEKDALASKQDNKPPIKRSPQPEVAPQVEMAASIDTAPLGELSQDATSKNLADPEAERRELVRQAMSELGKRSAAARAKKKTEAAVRSASASDAESE